jgi:tRNA pseudouridine55 synthase
LGVGAHLTALHRTQIGPWRDPGSSTGDVVTGRALLPWLPSREVTDFEAGAIRQGGEVRLGRVVPPEWPLPSGFHEGPLPVRAFQKERLIALLEAQGDRLRPGLWLRGL